jgi:hypothetical protein
VRDRLARNGVPREAIEKHLSVIGNPPAMEAALAWYRARGERQSSRKTKLCGGVFAEPQIGAMRSTRSGNSAPQ